MVWGRRLSGSGCSRRGVECVRSSAAMRVRRSERHVPQAEPRTATRPGMTSHRSSAKTACPQETRPHLLTGTGTSYGTDQRGSGLTCVTAGPDANCAISPGHPRARSAASRQQDEPHCNVVSRVRILDAAHDGAPRPLGDSPPVPAPTRGMATVRAPRSAAISTALREPATTASSVARHHRFSPARWTMKDVVVTRPGPVVTTWPGRR